MFRQQPLRIDAHHHSGNEKHRLQSRWCAKILELRARVRTMTLQHRADAFKRRGDERKGWVHHHVLETIAETNGNFPFIRFFTATMPRFFIILYFVV